MSIDINRIYNEDGIEGMKRIQGESISLILTDPPYVSTNAYWDKKIDFDKIFLEFRRILNKNGNIIMTATFPFAIDIIYKNKDIFKYDCVWIKNTSTSFVNAKHRMMRKHENILIFSKGDIPHNSKNKSVYNPQGLILNSKQFKVYRCKSIHGLGDNWIGNKYKQEYTNYPNTILKFKSEVKPYHPTQKPLNLFEYLVKTFSNENDIVLDPFIGSGTTAVAAINTNRNYIGFETDKDYYNFALNRIQIQSK